MAVATIDDSTETMKMATQQALTTQRRREADSDGDSTGAKDSGTTNSWAIPRGDHSPISRPERLTGPCSSACLPCMNRMAPAQIDTPELLSRARTLVPALRARAAETERLRRIPDATITALAEA